MDLQQKYAELISAAKQNNVQNLQVREQNNVLYIDGSGSAQTKDKLWEIYNKIDPDFRAGDLILDIQVSDMNEGTKAKIGTQSSNLNIRKGPGTDQPIVGKAAHNSTVTVLNRTNEQWSLIRTDDGTEGYVYNQYLEKAD